MKKWTQWFSSPKERRAYIKAERKKARKQGKKFYVLKRSWCGERCTGKREYFADLLIK